MAGFLSSNMESAINATYDTLHETFAQTITVFKNSKRTVISTNARYNSIYGRTNTGSKSNVEYTTESQAFEARVYYVNMDEEYLSNNANQQGTQNPLPLRLRQSPTLMPLTLDLIVQAEAQSQLPIPRQSIEPPDLRR